MADTEMAVAPSSSTPNDYIESLSPEQIEHDQKIGIKAIRLFLQSKTSYDVLPYYFQFPEKFELVDQLTLDGLRDIEKAIGVDPIETASIHPFKSLYEACVKMLDSKARRIPLIDEDEKTHREIVLSK
ncbi:hypothetical protein QCA50_017845 [Cerrena zonata]|uniref:Uncharacterized protein n=1 Tax=Cerrena zonata TaxID=2478898 RepID=A0AAW0FEK7_9APHY